MSSRKDVSRVGGALLALLALLLPATAQQTQSGIATEITTQLPSGQQIPIVNLRQVLSDMNLAIFQAQGGSGLVLSGTATAGQVITATGPNAAIWSTPSSGGATGPAGGALAGTYPNPTLASPTTINVALVAGATAGDKIANCVAALPSVGGVCDARSLPSGGVIPAMTLIKSGAVILGPCGVFSVTGSIVIGAATPQVSSVIWNGCGASFSDVGTSFVWAGNTTDPLFDLMGLRDSQFYNFAIRSSTAAPLAEGIRSETAGGATATNLTFYNIIIQSSDFGGLRKGFRWCTGTNCGHSGGDGGNDLNLIQNVTVENYNDCAFSIEAAQSKTHTFFNSAFAGLNVSSTASFTNGSATIGWSGHHLIANQPVLLTTTGGLPTNFAVNTVYYVRATNLTTNTFELSAAPGGGAITAGSAGTGVQTAHASSQRGVCTSFGAGGSFRWYGGQGGGANSIADFDLGAPTDFILIEGSNTENSWRFLNVPTQASAAWAISVINGRFAANSLNPDGNVIIYDARGPFTMTGFDVESAGAIVSPTFLLNPSGGPTVGNATGVKIQSNSAAAGYSPFICANSSIGAADCWNLIGNMTQSLDQASNFLVPNTQQSNALLIGSTLPACTAFTSGQSYFVTNQGNTLVYHGTVAPAPGSGPGPFSQWITCGPGPAYYQGQ